MARSLSPKSSIDVLKQDAKRWYKALHAADAQVAADARGRLVAAWPAAPVSPTLRDVQHALAREYDYADWRTLRSALDDLAPDRQSHAARIDAVLQHGWDGDVVLARRIVARFPDVQRDSIFTAAACGDLHTVTQLLEAQPELARATNGSRAWTPLHYVAYSRLDGVHAVSIAQLLLSAGADPNARFDDGWGNPFTALTGAIRLGEGARPSHMQARALVELLIARGADPFDTQALYNTSIVRDDVTWTALLWQHCETQGRIPIWSAVEGPVLNGPLKIGTLNYLLGNAVANNHLTRAAWLLAHGASARTMHGYTRQPVHTLARLSGFSRMTALLEQHGAEAEVLDGERALLATLLSGDEAARDATVRAMIASNPKMLQSAAPLLGAAMHGRATAVSLLLSLGADVNATDPAGVTALHRAAQAGAIDAIDVLIAAGADVDLRERTWQGTPMSWACVLGQPLVAERLAPISRDVRALARTGRVARLDQVLRAEPALANFTLRGVDDPTPLFCLPDGEDAAADVVRVLLAHGADRSVVNRAGRTAEQAARFRGLDEAAELLSARL
jgi:ankyrin repeat protein